MKVIDLIIKLQQLPQDLQVVYEDTKESTEGFKLVIVEDAEEIATAQGEPFVMLAGGVDLPESSEN